MYLWKFTVRLRCTVDLSINLSQNLGLLHNQVAMAIKITCKMEMQIPETHTCQHLEIINQDTFIIALTPSPPCRKPNILATLSEKRKIEADRSGTALCTKILEPFIRMVRIDKRKLLNLQEKELEKY